MGLLLARFAEAGFPPLASNPRWRGCPCLRSGLAAAVPVAGATATAGRNRPAVSIKPSAALSPKTLAHGASSLSIFLLYACVYLVWSHRHCRDPHTMWRLLVFAGLLTAAVCTPTSAASAKDEEKQAPAKRSPISASGIYGAAPQGQYVTETQELAPEYVALLQQYLDTQQQQHRPQAQHAPRARLGPLRLDHELAQLVDRPVAPPPYKHHQSQEIPLEVEQYHVETSPRRPVHQQQSQLYYAVDDQQQQHHQPAPVQHVPTAPPPPPQPQHYQAQPDAQQQLRYHQTVPIQYGYEDEQQIHQQKQSPESIVRAQAQAEAQALAFQKIAQASHYKHQEAALEQIRVANENHRKQSALEQIRQGEAVSEAGRQERIQPKDPESAYKAHLKAQATALVAEQRRAQEAAEYKAHADAIIKLQAQQRAHLQAQEEAHKYALNFEKIQQRAQEQAQAVANAQALALYKAHQQARAKAQSEAKQVAKAQADARRVDPDSAPVVQYLLPNKVPLPPPEVYLPKAAEALRAEAAQEKRLKKPQQIKHLLLEELDPQILRRGNGKQHDQQQQLAFLVDGGYYGKQQHRQNEYQGLQEIAPSPRSHYQQYQQQIDNDKLALLVPIESHA